MKKGKWKSKYTKEHVINSKCQTVLSPIGQVSFFIPLDGSVKGFECDLVFFITSRSFAVIGKFSILRHLALFDRVSNHDGWMSK